MTDVTAALDASCHCGAVRVLVPHRPREINECQCTLCRRYAAAWAYYDPKEVEVKVAEGSPTSKYVWGDRELEFHFCATCGCITQWRTIAESKKMGVNTRLMNPDELRTVSRRISFDTLREKLKSQNGSHPDDQAVYD